jgi:Chaperone of endosialidase
MGGANAAFANRGAVSRGGMGGVYGGNGMRAGGFGGGGYRGGGGFGGGGGGFRGGGGGGFRGGGGGGFRGGGGGGFRGGGGGGRRRSDIRLKHDIVLIGRLDDGLGYYRFVYNGGQTAFVGVIAQEVQAVAPDAVSRGADGYLRVSYDRLGLPFETYAQWIADGARLPSVNPAPR